jgi:hypothetical protein
VLWYAGMMARSFVLAVALVLAASGCGKIREIAGLPAQSEPSVALKSAETRWLLIKNPRFGDVPSEPEYVWVEEDKVPTTFKTLIRGKGAIIAPPEIVAKYGTPPGGGKISARQGVPQQYQVNADPRAEAGPSAFGAARTVAARATPATPAVPEAKRGYVVYVDTTRIVIDLISTDGIRSGSMVSLRRDRIPILHPVTGEMLGELDEEVGTARVTETRDKFSVAEIETVAPGSQIQIRDRVVVK